MRLAGVVALALVVATAAPVGAAAPGTAAVPAAAEPGVALASVSGATPDGVTFTGARLWDRGVNWCDLQPTADADVATQAAARLGPLLDELVASGTQRVIIPLGHSAPWVFGDSPQSQAPATRWSKGSRAIWFCGGHASAVSVPQPATLRLASDGSKPQQYQYFESYVDALMGYVQANYADRFAVTFQVMNEPNLLNGIDVRAKVAGAATTTAAAVASVVAMESITANLIRTRYPGIRPGLDGHLPEGQRLRPAVPQGPSHSPQRQCHRVQRLLTQEDRHGDGHGLGRPRGQGALMGPAPQKPARSPADHHRDQPQPDQPQPRGPLQPEAVDHQCQRPGATGGRHRDERLLPRCPGSLLAVRPPGQAAVNLAPGTGRRRRPSSP